MKNIRQRFITFLIYSIFFLPNTLLAQNPTEEWVARYNGKGYDDDRATAMTVDTSGNFYVTGYSRIIGTTSDFDYYTVKFDNNGKKIWEVKYNGPGNGHDYAQALAVDAAGNVYVTGYGKGAGTYTDYATVKYDSEGNELWVARYNGPGNRHDYAYDLSVDSNGNVYVTGMSYGDGTSFDYATIKYDVDGNEEWVKRYHVSGSDTAQALFVDSSANVYVTGYSTGSGTGYDYATIKYDTDGNEKWVARYNGPENKHDRAYAIAVDLGGSVYVTGMSLGSATSYDYATVKYDANGNEKWVAKYNGPENKHDQANAVAVDLSGSVYVTGKSYGSTTNYDYATIKYDSETGNQLWANIYNGPGNYYDEAYAVMADVSGNVYVTGKSYGDTTGLDYATVKYDVNGNEKWVARYVGTQNSHDIALALTSDSSGSIYVTGYSPGVGTGNDYTTIKYDPDGNETLVVRHSGPGRYIDRAKAVAVDSWGNVYVTGDSYNYDTNYDYVTIKYDAVGNQLWEAFYDGPGNSSDVVYALVVDHLGNAYVTGSSTGEVTGGDLTTIKYDSNGNELWVARYNGSANSHDQARALAVDLNGNVYVTGVSKEIETGDDYITIKYDSHGNELWASRYAGPGNSADNANAIAIDLNGNVYVTGKSKEIDAEWDYATVKYDSNGNELWVARYNGPGNSYDVASALSVDSDGKVCVTGSSHGIGTDYDYATIKYDLDGNEEWVARYNGPGNFTDIAQALAIDANNNVFVTGYSLGTGSYYDYVTIKYDSYGNQSWIARSSEDSNGLAYALAVDPLGNVYVTGKSAIISGTPVNYDYFTIKYNLNGNEIWTAKYNGPGNDDDSAEALAVDLNGNVYVTGSSYGDGTYYDYATIKYSSDTIDGDGDGVSDDIDNCPTVANPDQANCDGDNLGDACDPEPDSIPPTLILPSDVVAECSGPDGTAVDIGIATGSDTCCEEVTISNNASDLFSMGNTEVTWTAIDCNGLETTGTQSITVEDTTPPDFIFTVSPTTLWPPNHKMVLITPQFTVADTCDASVEISLVEIYMNEDDEENTFYPIYDYTLGDGHTVDDIQVESDGSIYLRAERSGTGNGRVYTIRYKASDGYNETVKSATVIVPHDIE